MPIARISKHSSSRLITDLSCFSNLTGNNSGTSPSTTAVSKIPDTPPMPNGNSQTPRLLASPPIPLVRTTRLHHRGLRPRLFRSSSSLSRATFPMTPSCAALSTMPWWACVVTPLKLVGEGGSVLSSLTKHLRIVFEQLIFKFVNERATQLSDHSKDSWKRPPGIPAEWKH